jgi:hypothetical protein
MARILAPFRDFAGAEGFATFRNNPCCSVSLEYECRSVSTVAFLIPCYGDGDALPSVLEQLSAKLQGRSVHVFLVDDCCPALDFARLASVPTSFTLTLLQHAINLGQGAALETARQHALATLDDPPVATSSLRTFFCPQVTLWLNRPMRTLCRIIQNLAFDQARLHFGF